jgi:arginine/lysine/histidine/glutamine transport system substrate-binding and permease protein
MKKQLIFILGTGIFLIVAVAAFLVFGNKQTVTIAIDPSTSPYVFSIDDADKKIYAGFDIELMDAIAAKSGFQVKYTPASYDAMMGGVQLCQYDAAIAKILANTEKSQLVLYSDPYFSIGEQVTALASHTAIQTQADLAGKRIGAQVDTVDAEEAQKIQGAIFIRYSTVESAFQDLLAGQIDAVISDNILAMKTNVNSEGKLKAVGDLLRKQDYVIVVCSSKTDVLVKINKGIAQLKSEDFFKQLTEKWLLASSN